MQLKIYGWRVCPWFSNTHLKVCPTLLDGPLKTILGFTVTFLLFIKKKYVYYNI